MNISKFFVPFSAAAGALAMRMRPRGPADERRATIQKELRDAAVAELDTETVIEVLQDRVDTVRTSREFVSRMLAARDRTKFQRRMRDSGLRKTAVANERGEVVDEAEISQKSLDAANKILSGIRGEKCIRDLLIHLDDDELREFNVEHHPEIVEYYTTCARRYLNHVISHGKIDILF